MSESNYLKLINQRQIIKDSFPDDKQLISYDLILYLCEQESLGIEVNVNQLFTSIENSYSVIRKYYFNLISTEYIYSVFKENNKKTKYIYPTKKSYELLKRVYDCL
jgi:hypothetical protein